MEFDGIACDYVIGNIRTEELPGLALTALSQGYDSESLRILAGLDERTGESELRKYFEAALRELGSAVPKQEEAILRLSRTIAKKIISCEIPEYDGSKLIWGLVEKWPTGSSRVPDTLWRFKSLASRLEDFKFAMDTGGPDYAEAITDAKQAITELADELLSK